MAIGTILAILGSALAIAAVLGAFFAKFRTTNDEETLRIWRGEAEAWKEKAERLEADMRSLTERVIRVEQENELLREMVTGRKALEALHSDLHAGFNELKGLLNERGN